MCLYVEHQIYMLVSYFWELFQNSFILFTALHERPLLLIEVFVELLQHGHLLLYWNVHIILHRVQGPQNKIEDANGRSE